MGRQWWLAVVLAAPILASLSSGSPASDGVLDVGANGAQSVCDTARLIGRSV